MALWVQAQDISTPSLCTVYATMNGERHSGSYTFRWISIRDHWWYGIKGDQCLANRELRSKWFSDHMILSVILLTIFSFSFCQSYFGCVSRAIHIFWAIFYYSWAISYILDAYSNTFLSDQLIMISDVNSKLLIKKIIGEWKYREKNMNYYDNVKRNRDDTMRIFVKFTKFMRCLNFVKAFYGWLFKNSRNGR